MSGLQIKLPLSFSSPSEIFKNDPMLAPGSLWLFDASRSFRTTGIPATGAKLDNIAFNEAKSVLGSGTEDSLAGVFTLAPGTGMTVERSGKGGIHTIMSSTAVSAGVGCEVQAPDAVKQYVINNAGHAWYLSAWHLVTRNPKIPAEGGGTQHNYGMIKRASWSTAHLGLNYNQNSARWGWSTFTGGRGAADGLIVNDTSAVVPHAGRVAIAYLAKTVAPFWQSNTGVAPVPPVTPAEYMLGSTVGRIHPSNAAAGAPSKILYRVFLEDLTVSGRTPAEVDAIGTAAFNAAIASGGAFFGDTYTDPATAQPT